MENMCPVLLLNYCITSMSDTSNEKLPLSTGKRIISAQNIDQGKWISKKQHLSRATKSVCNRLMLLYRCHKKDHWCKASKGAV